MYAALDCITPKWPPRRFDGNAASAAAAAYTSTPGSDAGAAAANGNDAAEPAASCNASSSPKTPTGVLLPSSPFVFLGIHRVFSPSFFFLKR